MSWPCPGSAARLLEGCWLGRAAALQASHTAPHPTVLRSCWLWLPPHAPSWYLCGCQDDVQKMKFLRNIVTVFTTAQEKGLLEGLDTFCRENKLTANIQVRGRLAGWGRWRGSLGIGQGCLGANIHGHPATPSGISGAAGTSALQGAGGHFWLGIPGLCQPCQQCWLCWRCVPVAARFHLICALQVLLEEKPIDYPCTDLWEEALLATSALRYVPNPIRGLASTTPGHEPGDPDPGKHTSSIRAGLCFSMLRTCPEGRGSLAAS